MGEELLSTMEPSAAPGALLQRRLRAAPAFPPGGNLWRLLTLVWPHRRPMTIGLVLGLGVALTYATSLVGMLPVLMVIVEQRNLHEYLREKAAASEAWFAALWSTAAGLFPPPTVPNAQFQTLLILLAALVGVNLAGNALRACSQYLILYASHRAMMDLRRRMYRKSLHVPTTALAGEVSNRISQFMSDAREVFLGITTLFGKVAREPLKAVCVFTLALLLDWSLTLVVVVIAPPAVGLLWYFGRQVRKATVRMLEGYGRMLGSLEETLQGIEVVKGYGREAHERRRVWGIERGMLGQLLKLAWIEAVSSPLIEVAGVLVASGGIVWLASQTISGHIEPSHFMTMVVLLTAMLDPIRKVANVYNAVQRAGAAAERIFDFLNQPEETSASPASVRVLPGHGDGPAHARSAAAGPQPGGMSASAGSVVRPREVGFERVSFRYMPEQDPPALREVSLTVRPGECVAIVGPNGSGKSTLVRLIPRLIEPCEGRVTSDGIDVRELRLRSLRAEIALVTQRPVIFARTVRENIAYGLPSATLEQVQAAARQAYAAEFIEQWPAGYDTVVGEFGASMSGGQRQRIAIARAFLKPATILIFDEATSEVDADSERKIHQALRELRRGKTTFLIAHRHTVMDLAERIVVMDSGNIVDVGTREELLSRCPLFVALYRSTGKG